MLPKSGASRMTFSRRLLAPPVSRAAVLGRTLKVMAGCEPVASMSAPMITPSTKGSGVKPISRPSGEATWSASNGVRRSMNQLGLGVGEQEDRGSGAVDRPLVAHPRMGGDGVSLFLG